MLYYYLVTIRLILVLFFTSVRSFYRMSTILVACYNRSRWADSEDIKVFEIEQYLTLLYWQYLNHMLTSNVIVYGIYIFQALTYDMHIFNVSCLIIVQSKNFSSLVSLKWYISYQGCFHILDLVETAYPWPYASSRLQLLFISSRWSHWLSTPLLLREKL